ncbi:MAG TPA: nitroreductase family deazaflavin-dependent oxidoreductase [Solirubrobacterales bacterium]|jgi:deazaflavin-dependent oxidoreductase (nitroreductase family)
MLFGQEHVERYEATDGEEGHDWQGVATLILATTGRNSGEERKTPLIYGEHDGAYLIVASKGGSDEPPAWYLNLQADPEARVQVRGERFAVHARDASAEEKPGLWQTMAAIWPAYDEYQQKTGRQIPVVVLERA